MMVKILLNRIAFYLVFCFIGNLVQANPFQIDFSCPSTLSNEEYINVQKELRKINIEPLVKKWYEGHPNLVPLQDFYNRCSTGKNQILIDEEKGFFPIQKLEKIGRGGSSCIVTYASYNGFYPHFLRSFLKELKASGFNGYILYRLGGFPNPTGQDIQYAGVPYSFKIPMMLEAKNLGFEKVLWLDCAVIPLQNIQFLFDYIDREGALLYGGRFTEAANYLLSETRYKLIQMTGIDVLEADYISARAFGLNMNSEQSKHFILDYYRLLKEGLSFFSCFPEEFVFSALVKKHSYSWFPRYYQKLFYVGEGGQDTIERMCAAKEAGYFFYYRHKQIIEGYD